MKEHLRLSQTQSLKLVLALSVLSLLRGVGGTQLLRSGERRNGLLLRMGEVPDWCCEKMECLVVRETR